MESRDINYFPQLAFKKCCFAFSRICQPDTRSISDHLLSTKFSGRKNCLGFASNFKSSIIDAVKYKVLCIKCSVLLMHYAPFNMSLESGKQENMTVQHRDLTQLRKSRHQFQTTVYGLCSSDMQSPCTLGTVYCRRYAWSLYLFRH